MLLIGGTRTARRGPPHGGLGVKSSGNGGGTCRTVGSLSPVTPLSRGRFVQPLGKRMPLRSWPIGLGYRRVEPDGLRGGRGTTLLRSIHASLHAALHRAYPSS